VLGYFIEVPARHADKLMLPDSGFTHRQTMAGAVRFNALALHEEASRIAEAGGHALAAEEAHFEELVAAAVSAREGIAATAAALAGSTSRAGRPNARPKAAGRCRMSWRSRCWTSPAGGIRWWRRRSRPGANAVANDCRLAPEDRLWLVGGPNMGGNPPSCARTR
jgi:DNA mismatch repair protein MutS